MTMQAIVEQGTLVINDYQINTDDKILRDGNYYSSKPPVLSVAGAGVYFVLYNVFNLDIRMLDQSWAIYFINLILVGGSFFALLFILHKTIKLLDIRKEYRTWLLLGFGLGTLFFSFFISLNNHTIAGSLLFIGFYFLLKLKLKKSNNYKKYLSLSGFFISLAAVIDIPTGLTFLFLFFIYCLVTFPKKYIIYYILAALPMLILQVVLNYQVTGDFLLPQFHPEFWDPVSVAYGTAIRSRPLVYLINILFGTHGLFLYTPILLFSIYSIYKILRNRKAHFRLEALIIFVGFLIIILYYSLKVRVYTGASFGYRWLIAITPLLYFFLLLLFTKKRSYNFLLLFTTTTAISIVVALIGFLNPWGRTLADILLSNGQIVKIDFPLLVSIMVLFE
ncbi:hypothetical protein HOB10_05110 [Candidatus Parcubacteria bacterium]|nr:hypothetical protein [Candidatus Parcubacteria bacterium]